MIEVAFKDFQEVFDKLVEEKAPFVAVFSAEKDDKGDTWCPDCKTAAPFYPEVVERAHQKNMKVYLFYVGPREVYKSPEHPFRTNKLIKLTCIPTIALFDGKLFTGRLQEDEILVKQMREILFE